MSKGIEVNEFFVFLFGVVHCFFGDLLDFSKNQEEKGVYGVGKVTF